MDNYSMSRKMFYEAVLSKKVPILFMLLPSFIFSFVLLSLVSDQYEIRSTLKVNNLEVTKGSLASNLSAITSFGGLEEDQNIIDFKKIVFSRDFFNELYQESISKDVFKKYNSPKESYRSYIKSLRASNSENSYIDLTYKLVDPDLGEKFLSLVISLANNKARNQTIYESENALTYLRESSADISDQFQKTVINDLVKANLERKMLAITKEDYLLKIIDYPSASDKSIIPNRIILALLASIFIAGLQITSIILQTYFKNILA